MRSALLLIFGALLVGCAGSAKQLRLTIRPSADMNETRSCYLLARAVDEKVYGVETYDDVAAIAMAPDATVERALVVVPGVPLQIDVPLPEKGRLAVYALFKQPDDDSWRVLLPASTEAAEIRMDRARMCWISGDAPRGAAGLCTRSSQVQR